MEIFASSRSTVVHLLYFIGDDELQEGEVKPDGEDDGLV